GPQEGEVFNLTQERQPNNDGIESSMGDEGGGIRGDKPRPIATAGYYCPPFGYVDGFRRSINPDNEASISSQPGDQERCVASSTLEIEKSHAAFYAGPPQSVFGKVRHGDDPKSRWPHFISGINPVRREEHLVSLPAH